MEWEWTDKDEIALWLPMEFFNAREAWGDPFEMHPLLIFIMEKFRQKLPNGCWIKIHCGFKEKGHQPNSFHYVGRACDFHVIGCSFLEAERHLMKYLRTPVLLKDGQQDQLINFVGVGNYPEWNDPGFHLDIRGTRASWARLNNKYVAYELGLEKARELNL